MIHNQLQSISFKSILLCLFMFCAISAQAETVTINGQNYQIPDNWGAVWDSQYNGETENELWVMIYGEDYENNPALDMSDRDKFKVWFDTKRSTWTGNITGTSPVGDLAWPILGLLFAYAIVCLCSLKKKRLMLILAGLCMMLPNVSAEGLCDAEDINFDNTYNYTGEPIYLKCTYADLQELATNNTLKDVKISVTSTEAPYLCVDFLCDGTYDSYTSSDVKEIFPLCEQFEADPENNGRYVISSLDGMYRRLEYIQSEFSVPESDMEILYFTIKSESSTEPIDPPTPSTPSTPCNSLPLEIGYSKLHTPGEVWFRSTTYYLPIIMSIYPEQIDVVPEVYMDLTCDGNYEDPTVKPFIELLDRYSEPILGMKLSFPLLMNNLFKKEIKNGSGQVIGYRFEFPAIFRTMLLGEGATTYAPAYVGVKNTQEGAGNIRIVIESGLATDCREDIPMVEMDSYVPVNQTGAQEVYVAPIGQWLNQNYELTWEGEGAATLLLSKNCDMSEVFEYIELQPNQPYRINAERNKNWITTKGTEVYLQVETENAGNLKIAKVEAQDEVYIITSAVICDVPAVIDQTAHTIKVTISKECEWTSREQAMSNADYGYYCSDGVERNVVSDPTNMEVYISGNVGQHYKVSVNISNAQDEDEYYLSTDASLKSLTVGGVALPEFNPAYLKYTVPVSSLSELPTVAAEANNGSVSIAQATSATPTATITVTAAAGNTQVYTVHFVQLSTDATLSGITVDGNPLTGFISSNDIYSLTNLEAIPEIGATCTNTALTPTITQANRLPGYAQIIVTAEAGNTQVYTIFMKPKAQEKALNAYGDVNITPVPQGKVYLSQDANAEPTEEDYHTTTLPARLCGRATSQYIIPGSAEAQFTLWAEPLNEAYFFSGWNKDANNEETFLSTAQKATFTEVVFSENQDAATPVGTYYAHFRHPEVIATDNNVTLECLPTQTASGKIGFAVQNMRAADEMDLTITENSAFVKGDVTYAANMLFVPFEYTYQAEGVATIEVTLAAKDNSSTHTAVLTINQLGSSASFTGFVVKAKAGQTNVNLSWEEVPGASQYEIRRNGIVVTTTSDLAYNDINIAAGLEITYTVVAKNGATIVNMATVNTQTAMITAATAQDFTILLTHYATFPAGTSAMTYTNKELKDFRHLFGSDDKTLMDTLYVLADAATEADAICYVYAANAEKTDYRLHSTFNPRRQGRIMTDFNNKKLYFAGSCARAFTGEDDRTEGFFYFVGTSEEQGEVVDIYLDDATIAAAPKPKITNYYDMFSALDWPGEVFYKGGSSVFAFYSNTPKETQPLKGNFHIRGRSELAGNQGCQFSLTIGRGNSNHPLTSAPIASRPDEHDGNCVTFNFDDNWNNTRTNGWLGLRSEQNAPSIDLGNIVGKVIFNGGQYRLWGSYKENNEQETSYATTLAISYRHFQLYTLDIFGFGTDMADGLGVHIYDGTFSSYTAAEGSTAHEGVGKHYRNARDIRLPKNSTINGGSFTDDAAVYICENNTTIGAMPKNENKKTLCRLPIKLENITKNDNGTVQITLENFGGYDLSNYHPLADETGTYGISGLNVDAHDSLYIYIDQEKIAGDLSEVNCELDEYVNWTVAMPAIKAPDVVGDIDFLNENLGGNDAAQTNQMIYNAYLAFIELDDYTVSAGRMLYQDAANKTAEITTSNDYKIRHNMYYMMPVKSNYDYVFVPPFDINKIYVVEFESIDNGAANSSYRQALAKANYDLIAYAYRKMHPAGKKTSSTPQSLMEIIHDYKNKEAKVIEIIPYNPNYASNPHYQAGLYPQQDAEHAHFFLYEAQNQGKWKIDGTYGFNWDYVNYTELRTYDKKGSITSSQFQSPALMLRPRLNNNTGSNDYHVYFFNLPSTTEEDYWNERYIIFEGYGPQSIAGKNQFEDGGSKVFETNGSGPANQGQLAGNYTLANYTTPEETYIYTSNQKFERTASGATILPGQAYMAFGKTGETFRVNSLDVYGNIVEENNTTELQTLADFTLLVNGDEGNIFLRSFAQQDVRVYDVNGRLVAMFAMQDGGVEVLPATAGLYMVIAGEKTYKVIVK